MRALGWLLATAIFFAAPIVEACPMHPPAVVRGPKVKKAAPAPRIVAPANEMTVAKLDRALLRAIEAAMRRSNVYH